MLDRAVLEAAEHENKWLPSGSMGGPLVHMHLWHSWSGTSGKRSFRFTAVAKVGLSNRNASAVLGRWRARLVRGERADGRDGRRCAGDKSISYGMVCSVIV